jgi:hypothetical protein
VRLAAGEGYEDGGYVLYVLTVVMITRGLQLVVGQPR